MAHRGATGNRQFLDTIMHSGTLSDKIGALTLAVQEAPLHNFKSFESLISLATKRSRAQAVESLGALKDLFTANGILPNNRKLRLFRSQPLLQQLDLRLDKWDDTQALPTPLKPIQLVLWTFEDWLKKAYFKVIQLLEVWSNDQILFARTKAVDFIFALLNARPEQEEVLVRLLINKLGDNDKKVASKASYNILQLESAHPLMVKTIIGFLESEALFRPHQKLPTKYYAIITLNQTVLTSANQDVVQKLLDIYFAIFLEFVHALQHESKQEQIRTRQLSREPKKLGKRAIKAHKEHVQLSANTKEMIEKALSATLTGINRAVPFSRDKSEFLEKQIDALFKVTHSANLSTSIQALMLIQQIRQGLGQSDQRFQRSLYSALLDPRLLLSSKQTQFLNLLFKALREENVPQRLHAYAKRCLQTAALHDPAYACGLIYLLMETFDGKKRTFDPITPKAHGDATAFQEDLSGDADDGYNGRKRDPLFANALKEAMWETTILEQHYHPSVSLFAQSLVGLKPRPPKPDLDSVTLIHFLDRFEHKKPKSSSASRQQYRGHSIMQPLLNTSMLTSKSTEVDQVAPEEAFFQQYFTFSERTKSSGLPSASSPQKADSEDLADSDEDNILQALMGDASELSDDSQETDFNYDSDDTNAEAQDAEGQENAAFDDAFTSAFASDENESLDVQPPEHKARRARTKGLPTFAAAEDYKDMLSADESD